MQKEELETDSDIHTNTQLYTRTPHQISTSLSQYLSIGLYLFHTGNWKLCLDTGCHGCLEFSGSFQKVPNNAHNY